MPQRKGKYAKTSQYPPDEKCLAQRQGEPGPCQNARGLCSIHCGSDMTTKDGHCPNPAMPNGRCKKHGGKSLAGIASPQAKHLLYSDVLPPRMKDRFHEIADDPELEELRLEVALLRDRIEDLVSRADTGESGELLRRIRKEWGAYEEAIAAGDREAIERHARALGRYIRNGAGDYDIWDEIGRLSERVRKLVESERRRKLETQQMVSMEQASAFYRALTQAVLENVKSRDEREAVGRHIARVVGRPATAGDAGAFGPTPSLS